MDSSEKPASAIDWKNPPIPKIDWHDLPPLPPPLSERQRRDTVAWVMSQWWFLAPVYGVLFPELQKRTGWHPAWIFLVIAVPQTLVSYYFDRDKKVAWWKFGAMLALVVVFLVLLEKVWPLPGH
jgi:hypothetical protein